MFKPYLLLIFLLLIGCAPSYTLKIEKELPPLSPKEPVTVSFGGQSIVGIADTLGTLNVDTKNAKECAMEDVMNKALDIARQSGANGFHITSIDVEMNSSYIPCVTFKGSLLSIAYDYYDIVSTENELKEEWKNGFDLTEGIYEGKGPNGTTLLLAIYENQSNDLNLIYLSGIKEEFEDIWHEGQLKAAFKKSASDQLFRIDWINGNRTLSEDFMISTGPGLFTLFNSEEGFSEPFLKIYPTENDITLGSGSGFSLSNPLYIVTNHHVVDTGRKIFVKGVNGNSSKEYEASIVVKDEKNDLAIIKIINDSELKLKAPRYFISKETKTKVGENIFVLGYPLRASMGDELKITNGIISSRTGFNGDITSYQFSAAIQPGNSGGPLFDENGKVIGIVNAKLLGAENVSYAIKSNYLYALIDLLPDDATIQHRPTFVSNSITDQIENFRDHIYIISTK
ncbi:MAG: trypsin-like peptidase domain-containing protein [Balneolaceae bacterium]